MKKNRKIDRFVENKDLTIDFRDEKLLLRFVSESGKILPRRITGTNAKNQRKLIQAIKRARHLAIIPYVIETPR